MRNSLKYNSSQRISWWLPLHLKVWTYEQLVFIFPYYWICSFQHQYARCRESVKWHHIKLISSRSYFFFLFNGDKYIVPKINIFIWAIKKSLLKWKILQTIRRCTTYYKEVSISIILWISLASISKGLVPN
jgi:hypothetical protein